MLAIPRIGSRKRRETGGKETICGITRTNFPLALRRDYISGF
jgi:hypothetical protein